MNSTDIHRMFHPNTKDYTFSAPRGIFSKMDYKRCNQATLDTHTHKFGITPYALSDHYVLKLEFNKNSNHKKPKNSLRLKSALLNFPWVKEEIKTYYRKCYSPQNWKV